MSKNIASILSLSETITVLKTLFSSAHKTFIPLFLWNFLLYHYDLCNSYYSQFISFSPPTAILCAGVTSYKALKETEATPGDFVTIIGAGGGLGHLAIQYAKAMGLRVIAVDVGEGKLKYCESLGAELSVDATDPDVISKVNFIFVCWHE